MNSIKSNKISDVSSGSNKFVNGTKKAFENIKKFTKTKAFRLIIALIVIGVIITGVSLVIINLMKAIKQKCTDQPGTKWSDSLKMCIHECTYYKNGICNVSGKRWTGQCVPDNYCDYSDAEGNQYKYDPNTCECTIDCSDPEQPFTIAGKSYVRMKKNENNNTYIPEYKDRLYCGIPCKYNTETSSGSGGNGWCPPKFLCGKSKYKDGTETDGCFDPSHNSYCGNSDNICPNELCNSNSELCGVTMCGENDSNMIYTCNDDSDCGDNNTCMIGDAITESEYENDKELYKFKFYQKVGFCKNHTAKNTSKNCIDKRYVGEQKNNNNPINCKNQKGEIQYPNRVGISAYNNPCGELTIDGTGNACAKNGLCPNEWQAKPCDPSDNNCKIKTSCFPPESEPEQNDSEKYKYILCCDKNNIATSTDGTNTKFCCPIAPDDNTNACTLDTEYPFSAKHLGISTPEPNDYIECSVDEDCTIYNDYLWKNVLGNSGSNPKKEILNSSLPLEERSKYAEMYCASSKEYSGKKYCKAACGLFDAYSLKDEHINNNYGVLNVKGINSSPNKSYCFHKKNIGCEVVPTTPWKNGVLKGAHIPICSKQAKGIDPLWAGGSKSKNLGYATKGSIPLVQSSPIGGNCPADKVENTCLNTVGNYGATIHNITADTAGSKCDFTVACNQLLIDIPADMSKNKKKQDIYWNELTGPNNKFNYYDPTVWKNQSVNDPNSKIAIPQNQNSDKYGIVYRYNNNCEGQNSYNNISSNYLTPLLTKTSNGCAIPQTSPSNLLPDGTYCPNGIHVPTGNCNRENFGNTLNIVGKRFNKKLKFNGLAVDPASYLTDGQNKYFCSDIQMPTETPNPGYGGPIAQYTRARWLYNALEPGYYATCNDSNLGGKLICKNANLSPSYPAVPCCQTPQDKPDGNVEITTNRNPKDIKLQCKYSTPPPPPPPPPQAPPDKKITGKITLWTSLGKYQNFVTLTPDQICILIARHSDSSSGKGCNNFDSGLGKALFGSCPLKTAGCGWGECKLLAIGHAATGVKITPYYPAVSFAGGWPDETKMCTTIVPWYSPDSNGHYVEHKTPIPPMAQMVYFGRSTPCALKFEFADGGECP